MRRFLYTAQDAQGSVTTGALEAEDEDSAVQVLQSRGLFILSIGNAEAKFKYLPRLRGLVGGAISGREMVFFGEQLATLIGGGLPLVRALSILAEHSRNISLGTVLSSVTREVSAGTAFHRALEKHPEVFDEVWVSLVQAGEVSGQLHSVLRQITAYKESQETLRSKLITAVSYPAVLLVLSAGVVLYFILYIVPVFSSIFRDFNLQLPLITRVVLAFSDVLVRYALLGAVAFLGALLALRSYVLTRAGRLTCNQLLFHLPLFGELMKTIQLERLLTTLATLIRSGVSILNALSVLEGSFKNTPVFQNALKNISNEISGGRMVSESFRRATVFPAMVPEMMWMGEESGKLPETIFVISRFYQEQIDQWIRRFSAMIDPILVVAVGGLIAVIVMSIFMPIFQLSQISAG